MKRTLVMVAAAFAAACLIGMLAPSAWANSVNISTGVADWKFTGFTGFPGSAAGPATAGSAVSITRNPGWIAAPAGTSWVSALADGATNGVHGLYTYELTLSVPPLEAGQTYQIAGEMTSDNLIDSFKVNGVEQLTDFAGPTVYSFQTLWTVPQTIAPSPLVLSVRVYNEALYTGPRPVSNAVWDTMSKPYDNGVNPIDGTANPTGLLVSGTATLVPLPSAAWAGLVLLGGLGINRVRKSRA